MGTIYTTITVKEYRELYSNLSKESLINLLISDKMELRKLREEKERNKIKQLIKS